MTTELLAPPRSTTATSGRPAGKVAYLVSRFPKITETFILFELLALERQGARVELYPLQRERASVAHPEAEPLVRRAHFTPWLSPAMLAAHARSFLRSPGAYLSTLWTLLRANAGSPRYLAGAVAFFPKAVELARRMERDGVTHVHAHFASHPAAIAYVINRLTGIPFSFTAHGSDLHRDRHMLREKVEAADAVVAISEYNRRIILAECGDGCADKVRVVHCGIDTREFTPRTGMTPFDRGEGPLQIACVGTLHEVKGQRHLLDACALLRDRGLDFVCHLVGDGPDRGRLQRQAREAGLSERVRFHGRRTSGEVRELLRRTDVLAAPSVPTRCGRREGIPVVLMEALGSGVPVVASELSGIPELVDHERTGLLTAPGDASAVADALARLYHDAPLRRELAAAGRRKVEAEFNLTSSAAMLAELFFAERKTR